MNSAILQCITSERWSCSFAIHKGELPFLANGKYRVSTDTLHRAGLFVCLGALCITNELFTQMFSMVGPKRSSNCWVLLLPLLGNYVGDTSWTGCAVLFGVLGSDCTATALRALNIYSHSYFSYQT